MVGRRIGQAREAVRKRLVAAFVERYTPREVALSFSVGLFITALPTLGAGVLVFFLLAFLFSSLSKVAMLASVVVLNPVVKWGVYGASYSLGSLLLGPGPVTSPGSVSLSAGPDVLARLWLGNLILAVLFAVVGYVVAIRVVTAFRRRTGDDRDTELGVDTSALED